MYLRQPRYFNDFKCIGAECSDNCCYGWRITWGKDEAEKVLNAPNITPELKSIAESAFKPDDDIESNYLIQFNEQGKCPFQTEDGLCHIQKELGADFLSYTCKVYPRCAIGTENAFYRYCDTSCREITTRLLNISNSVELINLPLKKEDKFNVINNFQTEATEFPELKYRGELFEFFHTLISDKKIPVEHTLVLGALAAEKLTELVEKKQYDEIPEMVKLLRKEFHDANLLKTIEEMPSSYNLKFGFMSKIIENIIESGATSLLHDQTGALNINLYNNGEQGLREVLKGREFFLRNLALNLLLEFNVPFKFKDNTIFENYSLFVTAFGLIKLNLIAICSTEKGITMRIGGREFTYFGDDKLIGMTAIICRGICQSKDKAKKVIDLLNEKQFTTPAHLALLIK